MFYYQKPEDNMIIVNHMIMFYQNGCFIIILFSLVKHYVSHDFSKPRIWLWFHQWWELLPANHDRIEDPTPDFFTSSKQQNMVMQPGNSW